jgi:hypothetical protein
MKDWSLQARLKRETTQNTNLGVSSEHLCFTPITFANGGEAVTVQVSTLQERAKQRI